MIMSIAWWVIAIAGAALGALVAIIMLIRHVWEYYYPGAHIKTCARAGFRIYRNISARHPPFPRCFYRWKRRHWKRIWEAETAAMQKERVEHLRKQPGDQVNGRAAHA